MSVPSAGSTAYRIGLFGKPAAWIGTTPLSLPEKGYALVALLAFAARNELDRDTVRELLWPNAPAERRPGNLRQLLLRLGRLVPGTDLVVAAGAKLRLAADPWRIDAIDLFENGADARTLVVEPLLPSIAVEGEAFEDWLGQARRRVNERRIEILKRALQDQDLDPGDRTTLAEKLVACDPLDEAGYRALMSCHARKGDEQAARRWWLECRNRLNDELGIQPSAETRALAERLLLDGSAFPAPGPNEAAEASEADPIGIPTVVVMPPAMLPGNELLDRFGLVVLEEITLGLSQFGSFRVIAAYTSWQLSRIAPGPSRLNDTQLDYGVTIGIRNSQEPLHATCRLTRLATGEVLWTVELELRSDNVQASLNELVRKTVNSLAAALERAEGRSSALEPGSTGYRMYLEGKRSVGATGLESLRAARKWFRAAVKRCDEFSAAFAGLSRTLSMEWLVRGMTDRDLLGDALTAAQRAHACDPGSGRATRELGFTSLYLRRHDDSLAHFADARSLSPHDADLLADYADALMHSGEADRGLELIRSAKALNPLVPDYYRWIEATILYRLGRYEGARQTLEPLAGSPVISRLMAASSAMAGDAENARRHAAIIRENYPEFRAADLWQIIPNRRAEDTQHVIDGLVMAGVD